MCIDFGLNANEHCQTRFALDFLETQSQAIPIEIMGYLVEKYGGGPIIPCDLEICTECIRQARQIRRRRKMEKTIIAKVPILFSIYFKLNFTTLIISLKYETKITAESYLIYDGWDVQWREYLFQTKKYFKRQFIKGLPLPGPINNRALLND